jgi:hypothetical protein
MIRFSGWIEAAVIAALSIAACGIKHKVEVAPTHHTVEIKPIYMTVDVNIHVQKELDSFFEDVKAPAEQEKTEEGEQK